MPALYSNNAASALVGSLSTSSTALSITPGDGLLFPALGSGDWCMLTLTKIVGSDVVREIVKATARADDVFTIVRAQEGTTATTFAAGDKIELRITAQGLNDKFDKDGGVLEGPLDMADNTLTSAVLADCGDRVKTVDAGVDTLDYRDGKYQVWAPSPGAHTLIITNWPPAGVHGELWIEGVNLGACTITTYVPLDYLKPDGTYATTTSLNTNQGATLQTTGIDNVLIWGRNGAPKRAKVAR